MIQRIASFFSHVFLLPRIDPVFEELFVDKNEYYRADIRDWTLDGTFVALAYESDLKQELGAYKYFGRKHKKDLFLPYLRKCFDLFITEHIDRSAIITSAPLFVLSRLQRGYNQSALLARDIAKWNGLAYADILRKTRWTRHQAKLDKRSRLTNLTDAFSIRQKYLQAIRGKDIVLLDDIVSTGSTANECAKELKKAGAKKVYGLFLATGE